MSGKADVVAAQLDAEAEDLQMEFEILNGFGPVQVGKPVEQRTLYAVALGLQRLYTGMESVLEYLAKEVDSTVPAGATFHLDLLKQMSRPTSDRHAVIDRSVFEGLNKLRGFRHILHHAYSMDLDPAQLEANLKVAQEIFPKFVMQIRAFAGWLRDTEAPATAENPSATEEPNEM